MDASWYAFDLLHHGSSFGMSYILEMHTKRISMTSPQEFFIGIYYFPVWIPDEDQMNIQWLQKYTKHWDIGVTNKMDESTDWNAEFWQKLKI